MSEKGKTDLRQTEISLTLNGHEVAFDEITITSSVNSLPYVTASVFLDKEVLTYSKRGGSKTDAKLDLEEFKKEFIISLNHTYNIIEPVEGELILTDNIGTKETPAEENTTIKFTGAVNAPQFSINENNVKRTIIIQHPDVLLSSFDPSIYNVQEKHLYGGHSLSIKDTSITQIGLSEKIDTMLYTQVIEGDTDSLVQGLDNDMQEIVASRHQINKSLYYIAIEPILTDLLNVEHTKLAKWIDDPTWLQNESFHQHLASLIFGYNNFLDALITKFCPEFLMQYTPNINSDETSELRPSQVMGNVEGDPYIEIETELNRIDFVSNTRNNLFPIGSVIITGNPTARYAATSAGIMESEMQTLSIKGRWPKPNIENYPKFARQVVMPIPSWANDLKYHSSLVDEFDEQNTATANPDDAITWKFDHENIRNPQLLSYRTFLDLWAKRIFTEIQMASSVASITIPLNLKVRAGFCYKIIPIGDNGTLTPILQGFVTNVVHRIEIKDRQEGVAVTTIQMSHAHAPDFVANVLA